MYICEHCGKTIEVAPFSFNSKLYCNDTCAKKANPDSICQSCGELIYYLRRIDPETKERLCCACFNERWIFCNHCGEIISREDAVKTEDYAYCCNECRIAEEPMHSRRIMSYYSKPEPIFLGEGEEKYSEGEERYFGVELEKDSEFNQDLINVEENLMCIGRHLFYVKRDGSLKCGFEVVSHPATLSFHKEIFPWEDILKECKIHEMEGLETAGMHIHVNKSSLGNSEEEINKVLSDLVKLFYNHDVLIEIFSERLNTGTLDEWASLPTRYEARDFDAEEYSKDRYKSINTQNLNTVEFRIFSSPDDKNTILANIEFCDFVCELVKEVNIDEIANPFEHIDIKKYPYLYEKCQRLKIIGSEVA